MRSGNSWSLFLVAQSKSSDKIFWLAFVTFKLKKM